MNDIYVVIKRKVLDGAHIPTFEIVDSAPESVPDSMTKVIVVKPGESIVLGRHKAVPEFQEIRTDVYRVTNDNGTAREELIDTYGLERIL